MTAVTKTQLDAEIDRLLVNNTTGDIEANELNDLISDFSDSVTYLPTPDAPSIRSFSIQGQPRVVDPGFVLTGNKTFLYSVTNPGDVSGNLVLDQATTAIDSAVNPSNTSVLVTVLDVTFSAGQTVTFNLEGTDINTNVFDRDTTITARNLDDYVYFGSQTSSNAADFVPSSDFTNPTEGHVPAEGLEQTFTLQTYTGDRYLVIAQKATLSPIVGIFVDGLNQRDAFTQVDDAITINSENYDVLITDNLILDSSGSGALVDIRRL